jgi:hypothetical protein
MFPARLLLGLVAGPPFGVQERAATAGLAFGGLAAPDSTDWAGGEP